MTEFFLCTLYFLIFLLLIYKIKFLDISGISRGLLVKVFLLKISCGIALWAIYTFYYTDRSAADIYKYFDDSKVMFDALFIHPVDYFKMLFGIGNDNEYFDTNYYQQMHHWSRHATAAMSAYNDNHTIIRFNAAVRLFSLGYYNVHTIFMCFLSLIGMAAIYKALAVYFKNKKQELIIAVFLVPSLLFWSSGVLKEGILLFCFGMLFFYFFKMMGDGGIMNIALTVIFFLSLILIKTYLFFILLPGLISYYWAYKTNHRKVFLKFMLVHCLYFLLIINLHFVFPEYTFFKSLSHEQIEYFHLAETKKAGSVLAIPKLEPTLFSFVKNAPQAFLNVFIRPHLLEAKSPVIFLSAVENFIIFLLFIIALLFHKPLTGSEKSLCFFSLFFVLVLFVLIGEVIPIMGAVVRFKSIALPFLLIVLFLIYDKEKLLKKLPLFSRIIKKN